ncbi:MAG: Zn-ribbon containing protein, partial [Candidatus Altarchaeaceae archaeon]
NEEDYRRRIAGIEKVHVKEKPKEDKGLIELKEEKPISDLEWLEKMYGGKVEGVVSLDVETLRILRNGAYEIDIASLMADKPLILSPREGTFYIDLQSAMSTSLKKGKKKREEEE